MATDFDLNLLFSQHAALIQMKKLLERSQVCSIWYSYTFYGYELVHKHLVKRIHSISGEVTQVFCSRTIASFAVKAKVKSDHELIA